MTVYIEYAFLENFLLDGVLLVLSLKALKIPISWLRLFIAACLGGFFAVVYPLLSLTPFLGLSLKIAVGGLLPMLAFGRIRTRKEWGRYAFSTMLFFFFTFLFGGALLAGTDVEQLPWWGVAIFFALFTPVVLILIEKIYKRRVVQREIYTCILYFGEKSIKTQGFFDSGNIATKNQLPVCFLSAEIYYDLVGDFLLSDEQDRGQVCDEMKITTMTGEENIRLYKGKMEIFEKNKTCEVYFAKSNNMIGREYKVVLNAHVF